MFACSFQPFYNRTMLSKIQTLLFGVILLSYMASALLYAVFTPRWQAPDEPAHYNYIHYLATQSGFPELVAECYNQTYLNELTSRRFPSELSVAPVCYEFHQPPLYYLLATPIFSASNGSLLALRLFSALLGAGAIIIACLIGFTIFPNKPVIAYGTMAFVAFVPMHVAVLASVNNDALAGLILAILLLLLLRRLLRTSPNLSIDYDLPLGGLLGLGLLTKTTIYIMVPLIAIVLWLAWRDRPRGWPVLFKQMVIVYGVALLIVLPWFIRNATLYGDFDILGLRRHDAIVVGQLRTSDYLADVGLINYGYTFAITTFQSFWGQFGWMAAPMDERTYFLLMLLTLVALAGLVAWLLRLFLVKRGKGGAQGEPLNGVEPVGSLSFRQWQALGLMTLTVLLMLLGYGWYNLTFVQFQGRYLFPSLIPLGLFFSIGLLEIIGRKRLWPVLAGLLFVGLIWMVITSTLNGSLDKWAVLIIGLALFLMASRLWLNPYWTTLTPWLLALCYAGLGFLTLVSPFWFIVPYL
jgi:4-amino-4-deoxy-L-arabinose transferase-like glycosyltransferase